jgi:hypothetical protein
VSRLQGAETIDPDDLEPFCGVRRRTKEILLTYQRQITIPDMNQFCSDGTSPPVVGKKRKRGEKHIPSIGQSRSLRKLSSCDG